MEYDASWATLPSVVLMTSWISLFLMWSTIFCRPSVAFKTGVTETLEAQSAPKNKEDEIETKKAGTINEKTFGTGSEGGTSDKWRVTGDAKQHLSIVSSSLFSLCFRRVTRFSVSRRWQWAVQCGSPGRSLHHIPAKAVTFHHCSRDWQ